MALRRTVILALLMPSFSVPALAQEDAPVRLRIEKSGIRRVLVQMQPTLVETDIAGAQAAATELSQGLSTNLIYGGWVALQEPLPAGVRFPRYAAETAKGKPDATADYVLRLELDGRQLSKLSWVARVVEPKSSTVVLAKRYEVDAEDHGRAVRHLADAIVQQLTGEVGIAQTRVVFSRGAGETRELFLIEFDGRGLRRITRNGSLNLLPRWSPDGARLVYTSYWRGRQRLLILDGSSGKSDKIAEFTGLNLGANWSPDGSELIATLSHEGDPEVYRMRPTGEIVQRVTFSGAIDTSPSFDPTGRQIVYTSDRTGVPQIYVMDRDGTNRRRLTYEGSYNDSAAWSPRGDRIAYVSRRSGRFQIFTIEPDGSNLVEITIPEDGNNEDPSWAPDGRHLVVASDRDGRRRLWVLDVESGIARPLTDGSGEDTTPHWSNPPSADANAPGR